MKILRLYSPQLGMYQNMKSLIRLGTATLQLNGKWDVSNDSLQLIILHMSDFGKGMEMNDTMYYKIIQFKEDILVIKSLSNNDIYEYRREDN